VGAVSAKQIREIAELKYNDLNAIDMAGAIRIVEGTAKSMGIEITA
jgi:large subunit ribosomal protein L11